MKIKHSFWNFALAGGVFLSVLTGCNSSTVEQTPSSSNASSVPQVVESDPATDMLRVGIDLKYYPFMYEDESGEPAGLEPAISYAFGEYLGVDVEIINTDFSMLLPALDTGAVDIVISDMSSNESRMEKADFSQPYRYGHTLALVHSDFAAIHNITDEMSVETFFALDSARYVGLSGTLSVTLPLEHGVVVDEVMEVATAVLDISRGNYDVIVGGDTIRGDHVAHAETTIIYDGIGHDIGSCFVVKKGNTQLLEQANEFILTLYEDGGLYEQIGTSMDEEIGIFLQDTSLGLQYIVTPNV